MMTERKARFELWRSWFMYRWRLRATNGEIIASGEGFFNKADCQRSIELVRQYAPDALINDLSAVNLLGVVARRR